MNVLLKEKTSRLLPTKEELEDGYIFPKTPENYRSFLDENGLFVDNWFGTEYIWYLVKVTIQK